MLIINRTLVFGVILACWAVSAVGHVFVVVPAARGFSPGMDVLAVAGELKARGHHVYIAAAGTELSYMEQAAARHIPVTSSSSSSSSHGNNGKITFVSFPAPFKNIKEELGNSLQVKSIAKTSPLTIIKALQKAFLKPCVALFSNATAIQMLRESQAAAVLTYGLPFKGDSCGCAVSHLLGVPLVAVDGNPMVTSPLNTPQVGSGLTAADLKTWRGSCLNTAVYLLKALGIRVMPWMTNPGWPGFRAHNRLPPLSTVPGQCRPALLLKMTSFVLEHPQPLPPGMMLLGPLSPRLPRPSAEQQAADPDSWAFLQEASPSAGVVLVGFGSTGLFGNSLDHTDYVELAAGFSALAPTRVLWPMSATDLPEGTTLDELPLGENVRVTRWVDYNDVLGHPHIKAFVTHFGIHSKMEAAFHGVPVIGVPFQFEQASNGLSLVSLGMGEMCQQAVAFRTGSRQGVRFERKALADLVKQVMTDPRYAEAAARVSAKLQLYYSFRRPVQRAADEVEVLLAQPKSRHTTASAAAADASGDSVERFEERVLRSEL